MYILEVYFSAMNFETYYRELDANDRKAFADRAGTSREYIEIHLLAKNPERRKTPRRPLMEALAEASQGKCSLSDVVAHFFEVAA